MRFPIRDVIPSRSRPLVTWTCLVLAAAAVLAGHPAVPALAVVLVHALPLLVLGETVEDQLGHARHLGLLAAAAGVGAYAGDVLPAMTAGVIGAHLALFPTARILLGLGVDVIEVPSFFLAGCWFFLLVLLGEPLGATLAACALAAGGARLLRQPDRARWAHFDQVR